MGRQVVLETRNTAFANTFQAAQTNTSVDKMLDTLKKVYFSRYFSIFM